MSNSSQDRKLVLAADLKTQKAEAAAERLAAKIKRIAEEQKKATQAHMKNIQVIKLQTQAIKLNQIMGIKNTAVMKMSAKQLQHYNAILQQHITLTGKTSNKLKDMRGRIMGIGFAALFGGMALYRVFGGAMKALFAGYKEVMDDTSEFHQMTNQLSGAWTFFKFTLMDALMQTGLFQVIVGFLINLIDGISRFTSKHPVISAMITTFIGLIAVVGLLAMIIGQPILMLMMFTGTVKTATSSLLLGFGKALGVLALLAITIVLISNIWNSEGSWWAKVLKTIGVLIVAIGFGMALFGKISKKAFLMAGKAAWALLSNPVVLAIAAIITGVILLKDHVGGIGNAFLALGVFVLRILAWIGDAIYNWMIAPLRILILMINGVILALHAVGKAKNISTIDQPKWNPIGAEVDKLRDKLLLEGKIAKAAKEKEEASKLAVGNYKGSMDNISMDGLTGDLSALTFNSNLPTQPNSSSDIDKINANNAEAQKVANEYSEKLVNNSDLSIDIQKNMNDNLTKMVAFKEDAMEQFGVKSSTTQ